VIDPDPPTTERDAVVRAAAMCPAGALRVGD
jgi:ferredoxin